MKRAPTHPEAGFTLVEMLVALAVFALLSASGIALLRASVVNQERVSERLHRDRSVQRIASLLQADVSQAIARPLTGVGDVRAASLTGTSASLSLVRDGWANPGEHPRSSLQRVTWRAAEGSVARVAHLFLDGTDPGEAILFGSAVRQLRFRYRLADGNWSDRFAPDDRQLLPAAIEMSVDGSSGTLVVIAALPPRGLEPQSRPVIPTEPVQ